jgi:hypothetical protein
VYVCVCVCVYIHSKRNHLRIQKRQFRHHQ